MAEVPDIVLEALGVSPNDAMLVLDPDGVITWVSESARVVMGWDPAQLVGRPAFELLHPDELERAAAVARASSLGFAPRSTARYRIATPAGEWVECDLSVARLGSADDRKGLAIWVRLAYDQLILRDLLAGLLSDAPVADVLETLLGLVFLRNDASRCALTFADDDGTPVVVGSKFPAVLVGHGSPGSDPSNDPWRRARQDGAATLVEHASDLPAHLADTARDEGYGGLWVLPVTGDEGEWQATITIWTLADGPSPTLNTYASTLITQLARLVLRWRRQVTELEQAALHDPLTGLGNRRVLDALMASTDPGPSAGRGGDRLTILSLDLDGFKPVNDTFGHAAGDRVLQVIARRLEGALRDGEIVLRVGGDEFVVLCFDAGAAEAEHLADRLRAVVSQPVALGDGTVNVATSVGIATGLTTSSGLLEAADAALYRAKHDGGDTVRVDACVPA